MYPQSMICCKTFLTLFTHIRGEYRAALVQFCWYNISTVGAQTVLEDLPVLTVLAEITVGKVLKIMVIMGAESV